MTKKIGKIIMITAIVVFIVGVVGTLIYNVVAFVKEAKEIEKWYDEAMDWGEEVPPWDEDEYYTEIHKEYKKDYNKIITKYLKELLIGTIVFYFEYIFMCGYGRLVQDNYERTQATKELNIILVDRNKLKPENNQEIVEEETTSKSDE